MDSPIDIVHFEDEEYISRKPKVYDFICEYTCFLRGDTNKKNPYRDPDNFKACKKIYDMSKTIWGEKLPEIWCTDQLGFSAPSDKKQTIYGRYIEESKDKDRFEYVAKCIYDTRTIGGCFIWPKCKSVRKVSVYNLVRGGRKGESFLEDRADVALLEIKHFFEKYKEYGKTNYKEFICKYRSDESNSCWMIFDYTTHFFTLNEEEYEIMFEWLRKFNSFNSYCKWFFFNDVFVHNGKVVDIVGSDLDNKLVKYLTQPVTESIYNLSINDKKKMLDNVRYLVNARSQIIHKELNIPPGKTKL